MVTYSTEGISFNFKGRRANNSWLKYVAESEFTRLGPVSIVFCSDDYLLEINKKFLKHDYYTDVITFDYSEGKAISGDIMISIDSVRQNASYYKVDFDTELNRVMVHGLLHLIGYDDHEEEDITVMRGKENYYISKKKELFG